MADLYSVSIGSVSIPVEQGVEWIDDGTEEFDLGTLLIVNSTKETAYTDYADVEITIMSELFEGIVKKDLVKRQGVGLWEHRITVAEPVIKLSSYVMPDRKFDTHAGGKTTYKYHLETMLLTTKYGKTQPITITTATASFLDTEADEKEYVGGDLFKNTIDMFRSLDAIPTLNLANEIGHQSLNTLGSEITFNSENVISTVIDSDIEDYGLRVHSKLKNATFESDLNTGGTFYPMKDIGVTVRMPESDPKYDGEKAIFWLDSGIRRIVDARGKNIETDTLGILDNMLFPIVSKETWDGLTVEQDSVLTYQGDFKNNTMYFSEGDNKIVNVGTQYKYEALYLGDKDVLRMAIKRALYKQGDILEYHSQSFRDIEICFFYQPIRDIDVVQERADTTRVTKDTTVLNNQKDTRAELKRMGTSNKSLINRIGNDKYQITVRYYEGETIPSKNDYDSNMYRILKRQFNARLDSVDVSFLLVKNQASLNIITAVNQSLSPYTIRDREVETNFVYEEYIEFSRTRKVDTASGTILFRQNLLNAFAYSATSDNPTYNCQCLNSAVTDVINLSVQSVPMGSTFEFNAGFKTKKIAGYQKVADAIGDKIIPVNYADTYGEVEFANWYFGNQDTTVTPDLHPVGTYTSLYYLKAPLEAVRKQPNEIMAMTVAEHCVSGIEGFIVGDYFLQNNSLIKELGVAQGVSVVGYATNPNYTLYDKVSKGSPTVLGTIDVNITNYEYFDIVGIPVGYSWAVVKSTAPFNLYFAFNNTGTDLTKVNVNLLLNRPDTETL